MAQDNARTSPAPPEQLLNSVDGSCAKCREQRCWAFDPEGGASGPAQERLAYIREHCRSVLATIEWLAAVNAGDKELADKLFELNPGTCPECRSDCPGCRDERRCADRHRWHSGNGGTHTARCPGADVIPIGRARGKRHGRLDR